MNLIFVLLFMDGLFTLKDFYESLTGKKDIFNHETRHFSIVRVEDLDSSQYKSYGYTRRSYFKISIVKGQSTIHYNDQSITINEDALVFTNPLIPYRWDKISPVQSGYVCIFTEDFLADLGRVAEFPVFKFSGTGVIPLDADQVKWFYNTFEEMNMELQSAYTYKFDLIRCQLMGLIHQAQKLLPAINPETVGSNTFERITLLFTELLEQQFPLVSATQQIALHTPSDFAEKLNIHVNHLNKSLKEITGQTTITLINNRILEEAKALLKSTTWLVGEISLALGFKESNHFSAFFKRYIGITPKEYRRQT